MPPFKKLAGITCFTCGWRIARHELLLSCQDLVGAGARGMGLIFTICKTPAMYTRKMKKRQQAKTQAVLCLLPCPYVSNMVLV